MQHPTTREAPVPTGGRRRRAAAGGLASGLILTAAACALAVAPAVAAADPPTATPGGPPVAGGDLGTTPLPPDDAPAPARLTTTHALHAQGRGEFVYSGSGGAVIALRRLGRIRVTALGGTAVTQTATGALRKRVVGSATVWTGRGTLTLDGSSYRASTFALAYSADVDATAANPATGRAWGAGRGYSIIRGGVPVPFRRDHRVYLAHGSIDLNIAGNAYWFLGGPADGTLTATINNRLRVWDYSAGKDVRVTGTDPARTRVLRDGSTLYWGLRGAPVMVTGTAFRVRVRSTATTGTFTPAPGAAARTAFRGYGQFTGGGFQNVPTRVRGVTRVLLQP